MINFNFFIIYCCIFILRDFFQEKIKQDEPTLFESLRKMTKQHSLSKVLLELAKGFLTHDPNNRLTAMKASNYYGFIKQYGLKTAEKCEPATDL